MTTDQRWKQRFSNYKRALALLAMAVCIDDPSDLEIEGMIQRFEYTFELAWKTLKDYLENKGFTDIVGSKEAIRLAFSNNLITEGEIWMEMILSRNLTSHIYDSSKALEIGKDIRELYYPCLIQLKNYLESKLDED